MTKPSLYFWLGLLLGGLVSFTNPLQAQLISLKTLPLASGNQFQVWPSENLALGGVSIALDDPLLDPFVNPAKGSRLSGMRLVGSPALYSITQDNGSGKTLPLGVAFGSSTWFGGLSLAVQQLAAFPDRNWDIIFSQPGLRTSGNTLSDQNAQNLYVAGQLGWRIPNTGIALAAGVFWAGLDGVEGVEMLYSRSSNIEQFGNLVDYRLGLTAELGEGRRLEALLLHHRYNMTHDITYPLWFDDLATFVSPQGLPMTRNLDRSRTWGLHWGYVQPLSTTGWNIGGIATVNRKSHPKIPNYELMNLPRDPGNSWALNVGAGLSRLHGPVVFGVDLVFEPIWSHTWAEAASPVEKAGGGFIPRGGKTVDNQFEFTNWRLRIGVGRQDDIFGFRLGLEVRWIRYWLDQEDYRQGSRRAQRERWSEWTPSLGLNWKFPEFEIRYTGRVTAGTGQPGLAGGFARNDFMEAGGDLIAPPSGPLALRELTVWSHQLTVAIPLRRE